MLWAYSLQANACLSTIEGGNESPSFVLQVKSFALGLEVSIQLWQFLPEVVYAALEVRVGHEEVLLHIFLFHSVSSLAREDDEFSYYVHSAEVDAWIGLAVAFFFGHAYGLREWYYT